MPVVSYKLSQRAKQWPKRQLQVLSTNNAVKVALVCIGDTLTHGAPSDQNTVLHLLNKYGFCYLDVCILVLQTCVLAGRCTAKVVIPDVSGFRLLL